ncbi:chromosome partition protein [Erwinia phage Pastis]|nr:chromosome partition protein [Erwinia phage Pastis]
MRTVLDIPRNESGLVDKYIGTAYDVVKNVHDNLAEVKQVSFYMEDLVAISNALEALKEIQADLAVLNAIYVNLPFLRSLMTQVDAYMQALQGYKDLLASAEGATHIGTANGKTVQTVITEVNQKLDELAQHWADNQKLLANLGNNAMYFASSAAAATALAADLPAGTVVLVPADSSLGNVPVLYSVAANKTVSVLLNLNQLKLDLADAAKGSGWVAHTNTDGSTTTVKALLNKLVTDLGTANTSLGTLTTTVGQHTTTMAGLTSTQQTQGQTLATQQNTLAAIQQKQTTQDTAIAAAQAKADAAATATALAAVKATADAAAPQTALNAVKATADAAATKASVDALTTRVAALEAKNP